MKKSYLIVVFRCLFILMLGYVVMEAWAQWRFSFNSFYMPMGIRANIGMNSLEAFRLKTNYRGTSRSGFQYATDQFGFRISGQNTKRSRADHPILLGGDSRIFGYALGYPDTIAALLESKDYSVVQQAFPGASPAMFNEQMFHEGVLKSLPQKPRIIFYGYDREDVWNDEIFKKELARQDKGLFLRWLKIKMGGYLWSMSVQKVKSFLSRNQGWPKWMEKSERKKVEPIAVQPAPKTAPQGRFLPVSKASLLEMQQESKARGIPLVFMYLPRFLELVCRDPSMRDHMKAFCESQQLEWIDFYQIMDDKVHKEGVAIQSLFLDVNEGIHYSRLANEWIASEIELRSKVNP